MQELTAPITRVTVAEDRAFVRRLAQIEVAAGLQRWRLAGVAPVIVDKSVAVTLSGPVQLVTTQVVRKNVRCLPPAGPPLEEPLKVDPVALELLEDEWRSADALYVELLMMIAEQAAWGKSEYESWSAQLGEVMGWKDRLEERRLELTPAPITGPPTTAVRFAEKSLRTAEVLLDLYAEEATRLELVLEYCVPLATWRPYHQAEFHNEQVHFSAEARVWQNTGEDWNDVELVVSTERQSLGALPPAVPQDRLNTRKRNGEVVVQRREVEVLRLSTQSPGEAPSRGGVPGIDGGGQVRRLNEGQVPGIDDGGQVFTTPVAGRCSVPSDGYPVRVPLFEFSCPTRLENLLVAESSPQVVQFTRLQNLTRWPLLAGPVDLIREAGWVGRGRLALVAPGEGFRLGWGPQTSLRVSYHTENSAPEKDDLLGGWIRTRHYTRLRISNLSSHTHKVEVFERIPVSEIRQVEICPDLKAIEPAVAPDENGFLRWELEFPPRSMQVVEAAYWMRRRKEVVTA